MGRRMIKFSLWLTTNAHTRITIETALQRMMPKMV